MYQHAGALPGDFLPVILQITSDSRRLSPGGKCRLSISSRSRGFRSRTESRSTKLLRSCRKMCRFLNSLPYALSLSCFLGRVQGSPGFLSCVVSMQHRRTQDHWRLRVRSGKFREPVVPQPGVVAWYKVSHGAPRRQKDHKANPSLNFFLCGLCGLVPLCEASGKAGVRPHCLSASHGQAVLR